MARQGKFLEILIGHSPSILQGGKWYPLVSAVGASPRLITGTCSGLVHCLGFVPVWGLSETNVDLSVWGQSGVPGWSKTGSWAPASHLVLWVLWFICDLLVLFASSLSLPFFFFFSICILDTKLMWSSVSKPSESPVGCILANWSTYNYKPMIFYCNTACPAYVLNSKER